MVTRPRVVNQSGAFRMLPCLCSATMRTAWLSFLLLSIYIPKIDSQIEDIILDLTDPDDYVDQVVANLEQQQAERERHQAEAAARCRVRCLVERQNRQTSDEKAATLDRCQNDNECNECLKPCRQQFVNLAFCEHICQSDPSGRCGDSCLFIHRIYTQRPGHCPGIDHLTGYGALCTEACLVDADCPEENQKCCYNGCGHVCAKPLYDLRGVPPVPVKPHLSELRPEGAVLLGWDNVSTNKTGPIMYVVWVRWNVGKHHSDAHMTHWRQITQTTDTITVIKDISPGHWYQYQVSAVNINGSHDASPPTRAFSLSREPTPPGVPVSLQEGSTLVQGNHVCVSVQWKHPIKSDIPVTKYKIFWSKHLSKYPIIPGAEIKEHRQVISGDQLQFDLPDLDPESTYLVQIQSICQYGDTRLRSDRASIYINTYPLSKAAQTVLTTTAATIKVEDLPTYQHLTGINVHAPFFQNGLLRANVTWSVIQDGHSTSMNKVLVQWSPEACISDSVLSNGLPKQLTANTQDQHYVIYELRFDCRYVVRVMPISDHGAIGEETRMTFVTPSCVEVTIIGTVRPHCPPSVPGVPEDPANLQYSFIINSVNISAHLIWDPPLSDSPVIGYRVTWGQTLSNNLEIWDKNSVLTKVLHKKARSFQIDGLCEAITYLVRIQALSRIGPGKVATIQFRAPVLAGNTNNDDSSGARGKYHYVEFPITAKPHSWTPSAGASSHISSTALEILCVCLCIVVNLYYSKSSHGTHHDKCDNLTANTHFPPGAIIISRHLNNDTFALPVRLHQYS